jgi:hypothetical protein
MNETGQRLHLAITKDEGLIKELRVAVNSLTASQVKTFIQNVVEVTPRELFDILDQNGDGLITTREVGKAFRGKRKDEFRTMVHRMLGLEWRIFEDSLFEVPTNANGAIEFEPFEEHVMRVKLDNGSNEFEAKQTSALGFADPTQNAINALNQIWANSEQTKSEQTKSGLSFSSLRALDAAYRKFQSGQPQLFHPHPLISRRASNRLICDACGQRIYGGSQSYHCSQGSNFDVCQACVDNDQVYVMIVSPEDLEAQQNQSKEDLSGLFEKAFNLLGNSRGEVSVGTLRSLLETSYPSAVQLVNRELRSVSSLNKTSFMKFCSSLVKMVDSKKVRNIFERSLSLLERKEQRKEQPKEQPKKQPRDQPRDHPMKQM